MINAMKKKISVIGLGYIGLPTASLLAKNGYEVLGVDVNQSVVDTINSGSIHIIESGLDALVISAVSSGNLIAKTIPEASDIYILAVPTPFKAKHEPDLTYVESAAKAVAPLLKSGDLIILESTSPVGTTAFVKTCVEQINSVEGVYYAHCPERVIPGRVLEELVENDRIIGGIDAKSGEIAAEFYRTFVEGEILLTDAKTAELCKLAENSFRDVNIAYANELSLICDKQGINVWDLIKLANHHPRVNILQPGPGVGGHCIAVDPWFIVSSAPEQAKLIKTAREVNNAKPQWVINKVLDKAKKFTDPVIACFGVSFKPDIDDLRESPALEIVKQLNEMKVLKLLVVEPNIKVLEGFELVSIEAGIEQADIVLFLVDHKPFKVLSIEDLAGKCIIDTKGLLQDREKEKVLIFSEEPLVNP